jgi:hypothetical protein
MKVASKLEAAANIVVIVAAVTCAAIWIQNYRQGGQSSRQAKVYSPGQTIPSIDGLPLADVDSSFVLYVSSSCHFCTESMEFYRNMMEARNSSGARIQVAVLAREPLDSLKAYLGKNGFRPDRMISLAVDTPVELSLTPAMLQVYRTGKVERSWTGKLTDSAERQVLRILESAKHALLEAPSAPAVVQ